MSFSRWKYLVVPTEEIQFLRISLIGIGDFVCSNVDTRCLPVYSMRQERVWRWNLRRSKLQVSVSEREMGREVH